MRRSSPLLLALVVGVGCTFPDVTIQDQAGDAKTDSALPGDARSDSTVGDGGDDTAVEDTGGDGIGNDSTIAPFDTETPDFGPEAKPCDIDGDGFQPLKTGCSPPADRIDCDDQNFTAHPGVTAFVKAASPLTLKPAGDWNCDGKVEKLFPALATCASGSSLDCAPAHNGIQVDVRCGDSVTIITCKVNGLLACENGATSGDTQGCR